MIYVGNKKAKLYHGDYGPAQGYKGDTKIAGYTDIEKVGTSISGVDTYNDQLNPTIEGKSEQTVTANSPSPDYPSPIRSSENFDVVSCGRDPVTATTAHVTEPLRSVGNVSDSIEVSDGKVELVRRCTELPVLNWTRQFKVYDYGGFPVLSTRARDALTALDGLPLVLCTHGKALTDTALVASMANGFSTYEEGGYILARIDPTAYGCTMTSTNSELATGFSTWYTSHKVQLFHLLLTPTRTDITATPLGQAMLALRTVPGHTQVFTNAAVPPVLRVRIKEIL